MLTITVPGGEQYDEYNNEFITVKAHTLKFEHSLVSLSKWESKWKKPFLSKEQKTNEETLDYIKCMCVSQNVDPNVWTILPGYCINQILQYIEDPMTATWFSDDKNAKKNTEIITSELIYYWMVALQIPFECQKWHLNRLLTLVRVCNEKNKPPKKMSKREIMNRNRALNDARRQQLGTNG